MATLLIPPQMQFTDSDGVPYAGGLLFTYIPGTLVQKLSYQDSGATILNTNPIVLDDRGACVVFGDGDYRLILQDQAQNQIFDLLSSAPLLRSQIGAIFNCLGSQTLQQFRDCDGTTAAIQAAISAIQLEPGPSGPSGPQGVAGPIGPQGVPGDAGASATWLLSNPGYIQFGVYGTGPLIQFGSGSTDNTGHATVAFAKPFTGGILSAWASAGESTWWANVTARTGGSLTITTSSPLAGGSWFGGPIDFMWAAIGA